MKLRITIEPEPIVEFESVEELERWLDRNKRPERPKEFPFDVTYPTPSQLLGPEFDNWPPR